MRWQIVKTVGILYDWQEMKLCEKWAAQLKTQINTLPDHVTEKAANLVVYEVIHW